MALTAALAALPAPAAQPYRPTDDAEVLQRLPQTLTANEGELAELRRRLLKTPDDLELAVDVAGRYVAIGKQESDPRYYGYAQAALRPWWSRPNPPPAVLGLRAKILERDHRYDDATADLRRLLEQSPRDVQAWIELANIYRVQGDYAAAEAACERLAEFADPASVLLCRVPLQAVTGEATQAYATLNQLLPIARQRWPDAVVWVVTMQADLARALGRTDEAERHLLAGLELSPGNAYLLRAYADLLLDHDRAAEVAPLIEDRLADTGLLLRAAIAAKRLGQTERLDDWSSQLTQRFAEVRLRGGQPHGRYEARHALELLGDPDRAVELAAANWRRQKEMRDTRNLLEAVLAAGDRDAARPAIEFLAAHHTEDADLQRLVERLEELP